MDVKLNSESMYNLGNLALSIHGRGGPEVEEEEEMVRAIRGILSLNPEEKN
jgi:hypothetical protein